MFDVIGLYGNCFSSPPMTDLSIDANGERGGDCEAADPDKVPVTLAAAFTDKFVSPQLCQSKYTVSQGRFDLAAGRRMRCIQGLKVLRCRCHESATALSLRCATAPD